MHERDYQLTEEQWEIVEGREQGTVGDSGTESHLRKTQMNPRRGVHYGQMGPVHTGPKGVQINRYPRRHLCRTGTSWWAKQRCKDGNFEDGYEMARELHRQIGRHSQLNNYPDTTIKKSINYT